MSMQEYDAGRPRRRGPGPVRLAIAGILIVILIALVVDALAPDRYEKLTPENLRRIRENMTLAEVEAVLGPGKVDEGALGAVKRRVASETGYEDKAITRALRKGRVWVEWREHSVTLTLTFDNNRLSEAGVRGPDELITPLLNALPSGWRSERS